MYRGGRYPRGPADDREFYERERMYERERAYERPPPYDERGAPPSEEMSYHKVTLQYYLS